MKLLLSHPDTDVNLQNKVIHIQQLTIWLCLAKFVVTFFAIIQHGNTALILVSQKGHIEIVKLLLAHPGIDVNHQNAVRCCC